MVDWAKPTLSTAYAQVLTDLNNKDIDVATMFIGSSSTNIPTNAIRLNSGSSYLLERWNSSAWVSQDLSVLLLKALAYFLNLTRRVYYHQF